MSIIHKQVEVERSKPAVFNFMRFYMIADRRKRQLKISVGG